MAEEKKVDLEVGNLPYKPGKKGGNGEDPGLDYVPPEGSYSCISGATFRTRIGPDYSVNKKKAESAETLFEVFAVDVYQSDAKVSNIGQHVKLPKLPKKAEKLAKKIAAGDKDACNVPYYMVMNLMIPAYAPSNPIWGSGQDDGKGYSLVFYLKMKNSTIDMCMPANKAKRDPALPLIAHYIKSTVNKEDDFDDMFTRMKGIARVVNLDECNFNSATSALVNRYNETPFLIKDTASWFQGDNYFGFDADVHRFSYLARVGLNGVRPSIPDLVFDFGFVVQANTNEELPERMLAATRFSKLNLDKPKPWPHAKK